MSYNNPIAAVHLLSQCERLENFYKEYVYCPVLSGFVRRTSSVGKSSIWYHNITNGLFGFDENREKLNGLIQNIKNVFQEIQFLQSDQRDLDEHRFQFLSLPARILYGACYESSFARKAARVFSLIFEGSKEWFEPSTNPTIAKFLFSEISGIPVKNTEKALFFAEQGVLENQSLQKWITLVNNSCLALMSPGLLSSMFRSNGNDTLKWNLYQAGLCIGSSGESGLYIPEVAKILIRCGIPFKKNEAMSEATQHLNIKWYFAEDYVNSKALIITSAPLLLGLWEEQRKDTAQFLFPVIPLYRISPDGQEAIVERPVYLFSEEKIWDDKQYQTSIILFLRALLKLSYTHKIDLNTYGLLKDGSIVSLAPMVGQQGSPFSWLEFEEICCNCAQNDPFKLQYIYQVIPISNHPDISWICELFNRYGLFFSEWDFAREMVLGRYKLQNHATEIFTQEILTLQKNMQATYQDIQEKDIIISEELFIQHFFEFCLNNPPLFQKLNRERTDQLAQILNKIYSK